MNKHIPKLNTKTVFNLKININLFKDRTFMYNLNFLNKMSMNLKKKY